MLIHFEMYRVSQKTLLKEKLITSLRSVFFWDTWYRQNLINKLCSIRYLIGRFGHKIFKIKMNFYPSYMFILFLNKTKESNSYFISSINSFLDKGDSILYTGIIQPKSSKKSICIIYMISNCSVAFVLFWE